MSRTVPVLFAAVACLVLGACAQGKPPAGPGAPASGTARVTGTPPATGVSGQVTAQREADRILATFRAPAGAVRASGPPAGTTGLDWPMSSPGTSNLVDDTAWFTASGTAGGVSAAAKALVPAGALAGGTFSSGDPTGTTAYGVAFDWPVTYLFEFRSLQVATMTVGGRVVIRVDAMVTYRPARPADATIPATAGALTLSLIPRSLGISKVDTYGPVTITDPAAVARAAAIINAVPMEQLGARPCPAQVSGSLRMVFRGSVSGPILDTVSILITGCAHILVQPADGARIVLDGGSDQVNAILATLGLNWPRQQ